LRFPSGSGARPGTPGKDGSDRDAMTTARLGRVDVPETTTLPLAQPAVVARSRSALRLALAGVAVTSAVVGWVLFGDTNPAIWTYGYWPVRDLTIALTALFVGVYFAVLAALSGGIVAVRYRWVAVAVATIAVVAAEPVRRRIQIWLERRFLGERGDPLRVLARLHATLSNGNEDESTAYATITRTVATAVRSPAVALALQRGPQIETVSVTGTEQDPALVLPLVYRGERMGEMRVSTRTPR
jgi:hypothetical protein